MTETMRLAPGSAGVSPALVGVPPTSAHAPIYSGIPARKAIGETPMAATGTVALPEILTHLPN